MQRLIGIVISIIFTVPIFQIETYVKSYQASEAGLTYIKQHVEQRQSKQYELAINSYVEFMTSTESRSPVIRITYKEETLYQDSKIDINSFRGTDLLYDQYQDIVAFSDNTKNIKMNAIFGIIRTLFVCIVLSISSIYFSKDTTDLVVRPIEVMLEKVKKISNNPLEAA